MVITGLDNYVNQNKNQDKNNDTNTFFNNILTNSELYYKNEYNSPFFSGMLDITPALESHINDKEKMKDKIIKTQIQINEKINNLDDLIHLCDTYPLADNIEYNINMVSLPLMIKYPPASNLHSPFTVSLIC